MGAPDEQDRLSRLSEKIAAKREDAQPVPSRRGEGSALGLAYRLTVEMLAGIGVGGFLGWWLDKVLGTAPLCLLSMLFLGMGAGLMNSVRTVAEMRRALDKQQDGPGSGSD